jgi:hypothetical protein
VIDWSIIEGWPLAEAIRRSVWAYPILEAVHIAAFATLVGSLMVLELRVFGAQPSISHMALGRLVLRIAVPALMMAALAGALLFVSDASQVAANPAFRVKLVLILMALANAVVFHARDSLRRHDRIARWQAGLSIALWLGVITAGRMIAYL